VSEIDWIEADGHHVRIRSTAIPWKTLPGTPPSPNEAGGRAEQHRNP
jgi:hypothetical protein